MAKLNSKSFEKVLSKCINLIPIIFAAFISASFTWHFSAGKTPFILPFFFGILFQLVHFGVFDIARRPKRKMLFVVYFLIFFLVFPPISEIYEMIMASKAEIVMYDGSMAFYDWFFGNGAYLQYAPGYCCTLFMLISAVVGTTVYFYTKIYLRISVLFLLSLFPPVIYAKDYESYPVAFCVILMLLFWATIIYCNHLKPQLVKSQKTKPHFGISTLSYLALTVIIALIIPKPDIKDQRSAFDEFTQGKFSSSYGRVIDNFTQTSNGNNTGTITSDRELIYIGANELLNMKTQCYYYYDDKKDCWLPFEDDKEYMSAKRYYINIDYSDTSESEIDSYNPEEFISEIIKVCSENPDFASKYNLESLIGASSNLGDFSTQLQYATINENFSPSFFLTPENAYNLKISHCGTNTTIIKSQSGTLYPMYLPENGLLCYQIGNIISIDYISPQFVQDNRVQSVLRALSYEDYDEFFKDLFNYSNSQIIFDAYLEYLEQNKIYNEESERVFSKKIRDLAESITEGLYSDYEKAKAIEQYFTKEGYKYDIDYVCPEGENITDFIFNEKKGSCYHYATAMVLLCRSVGLDARYCEGFSYSEKTANYFQTENAYKIKESDSHAFPEVYISGYGWMRFEPTVADEGDFALGSIRLAMLILCILLIAVVLALVFAIVIFPILEKAYLNNLAKKMQDKKLCRYIMNSVKKTANSDVGASCIEIARSAYLISDFDITPIVNSFDTCIYGEYPLSAVQMQSIIACLFDFRKAYREKKRYEKKRKRGLKYERQN